MMLTAEHVDKLNIAELCNGSTADSDSACEGSNPSSAAMKKALAIASAFFMAAEEGFEPSQAESESAVLPLHNSAIFNLSTCSAVNIIYYIRMQRTCQYLFFKKYKIIRKKRAIM